MMPPEGRPAPEPVEHAPELADTEASLLARAQAGDVGAFERLSGAYADRVFMLLLRLLGDRSEAEDVAQEVMLRAWQGITRFRGQSSYFTWLYRIAVGEANRALERRSRCPAGVVIGADELQLPAPAALDPSRQAENSELRRAGPWPSCHPRCGPPSCCVTSRDSPRRRPPRSPGSARPPSKADCTRHGCASGSPSATRPWSPPADEQARGPSAAGLGRYTGGQALRRASVDVDAKTRERRHGMKFPRFEVGPS